MASWRALPDSPLDGPGRATQAFMAHGLLGFREAERHLSELPYGRTSDRAGFELVLAEGRGTCSTKSSALGHLIGFGSPPRI